MNPDESLLLGFDPGREKCGLALVGSDGQLYHREVVSSAQVLAKVQDICQNYRIQLIVLGNQTTAKQWLNQLQIVLTEIGSSCRICLVDERYSSQEARLRYWDDYPAQGWNWILPKGMRTPPTPYDDIVAQILVERYLSDTYVSNEIQALQ
jgi:RNase H-fold protein (predicted Holliday junction resolvase)